MEEYRGGRIERIEKILGIRKIIYFNSFCQLLDVIGDTVLDMTRGSQSLPSHPSPEVPYDINGITDEVSRSW